MDFSHQRFNFTQYHVFLFTVKYFHPTRCINFKDEQNKYSSVSLRHKMMQIQWKPPFTALHFRCLSPALSPQPLPHAPTPRALELGSYKCTYLLHKYSSVYPYKCIVGFCMLLSFDINDILHVFVCKFLFPVQHKIEIDHYFLCLALAGYSG